MEYHQRSRRLISFVGPNPHREILEYAILAALKAGSILRSLFDKPHKIRYKGDIDLVTEADVASEEAIIEVLKDAMGPDISILAEESGQDRDTSVGPQWIVDPLDGTTNFAHGFPFFGISICYGTCNEGRSFSPHVGTVYCPMQDELFWAVENGGAWLNEHSISTSPEKRLSRSLVATGFPYDVQRDPDPVLDALKTVLTRAQGVRRAGAAAVDLAYLAAGRFDAFWEMKLKPWDTAAGMLLVIEAGGRITDFAGGSYSPFLPEILATNAFVHEQMCTLLSPFSRIES